MTLDTLRAVGVTAEHRVGPDGGHSWTVSRGAIRPSRVVVEPDLSNAGPPRPGRRSEEHTSELQSRGHLVCRLLLAKKKNQKDYELKRCDRNLHMELQEDGRGQLE